MAKLDLAFQLSANADGVAAGVAQADRELSKVGASAKATAAEFRQAAKITAELRTPTEKYADTIGRLDAMMQKGILSQEVYGRAVAKADAELKAATSSTDKLAKKAGIAEQIVNRTSAALRGVGDAVGSIASAGSSVIAFGEDFARASAEIVAATTAWRLFSSATAMFRTPEGIWGIATGLSRALVVIKLAEVGLTQLGIEAKGAADFATKATLAFAAFKVGKFYGLDKKLAPFIASLTTALPAALARVGIPIATTTAAVSSLGVVGNFVGGQLAKYALMSIPGFGQLAATVYVVGKAFLGARERAYEMASAIRDGTTSLEELNAQIGQVQAQQVDNLAFAMEEATAAGERSESAFAGLADVFVTPFIGAFAAVQSGLAGFTDGISGVIEGITSIVSPIAQVIAPVFTLIGTLVEGVLKFVGVMAEALGVVLKVAGAVVHTFLSPFIVGLTNVVEAIRSGMNAAFGYIGDQIDWASQKIKDFYAFMSKVPIIGRAFASGESPAAGAAANAAEAQGPAEAKDTLDADLKIYNARLANQQAIADADKKAAQERIDMEQQIFEAQRANEESIDAARKKAEQEKFDFEMQLFAAQRENEQKLIEADRKRAEDAGKVDEKMAAKQEDIDKVVAERQSALGGKSNEALKANDVRSSEGMAQFLALATGREDPAIAEYRKQTLKLDEIRGELRALQTEKVTILNGAGA
jgi:phage-related protein